MVVLKLTKPQADQLKGKEQEPGGKFNPQKDGNGIWFISKESAEQNENELFNWVKALPEMDYVPPPKQNILPE